LISRVSGRSVTEIFPIKPPIQKPERGPRGVKTLKKGRGEKGEGGEKKRIPGTKGRKEYY